LVDRKIVLGIDPGKNNFAISVVRFGKSQPKIIHNAMLDQAIKSLLHGAFDTACQLFRRAVRQLIIKYRPWRIIIERFLTRFRGFGNTGELIGVMIGIIWSLAKRFRVQMILTTAASWKNQFHRDTTVKLKDVYKNHQPIPVHCLDAALIAVYGYSRVATYQKLDLSKFFWSTRQQWLDLKRKK
jgi:Holliday junction resolvasome RuvABC endonuclease subunit